MTEPVNLPKPVRAPRVPKRIARKSRPRRVKKTSRGKLGRLADRIFSLLVRAQGACRYHLFHGGECAGPLQCAHLVSRIYRSVRWDEDNAIPLCAGAHRYMTSRPLEWERFITTHVWNENYYADIKRRALATWDKDLDGVLERLKQRATVLEIKW